MANGRNWTNIVAKKWSWYSNKFVATVFCHFRATSDTGDPLKYTQEPKTALESKKMYLYDKFRLNAKKLGVCVYVCVCVCVCVCLCLCVCVCVWIVI